MESGALGRSHACAAHDALRSSDSAEGRQMAAQSGVTRSCAGAVRKYLIAARGALTLTDA